MMMMYSMAVLGSCWMCLPVRWVRCSWPCGIHGNERHSYVVCVHSFLLLCRLFVRYHVCLPTHLLTNTALYCSMTTLKSLSRLDDHQENENCSSLACLCCQGTYVLHDDDVMKIVGRSPCFRWSRNKILVCLCLCLYFCYLLPVPVFFFFA
jgi:hypothetical protein